ncbi:uncharacterized protein [Gossypium hirsutum]|uniref:Uncharacterized protein n=1 Tax=Gossypium hirsutum TaxID=3635 RepID=A0ABM3B350_GOSHI|nr:uncharacterized protein LOC121223633 [Gossypium hirsutum]
MYMYTFLIFGAFMNWSTLLPHLDPTIVPRPMIGFRLKTGLQKVLGSWPLLIPYGWLLRGRTMVVGMWIVESSCGLCWYVFGDLKRAVLLQLWGIIVTLNAVTITRYNHSLLEEPMRLEEYIFHLFVVYVRVRPIFA